jgi:hypothetical protein
MTLPRRLGSSIALSALALGTVLTALPQSAEACGGLFCSRQRVDQAGEKILFATDGENVTVYVQIQYTGDAQNFSWIVPVPSEPVVGLGSDSLFTALRATTRPQFCIKVTDEGQCKSDLVSAKAGVSASAPMAASAGAMADNSAVQVLQQEQLGAFDVAVLKSDDPGALKKWLLDNQYVIPDKMDPLLVPYVSGKYDFVAVKLQKNATAGDIQPIVMKYKSTKPGIPIRLTGIAATPDMDVYVWTLGQSRFVPDNYLHAVINEARIDWLNYSPTALNDNRYRETVTAAMHDPLNKLATTGKANPNLPGDARGQGFVTDYAGDSSAVDVSGFRNAKFPDVDALAQQTDPIAFTRAVVKGGYFDPVAVNSNGPACPAGYSSGGTGFGGGFRGGFIGGGAVPIFRSPPGGLAVDAPPGVSNADQEYLNVNARSVAFLKRYVPMPDSLKAQNLNDFQFYSQIGRYRTELTAAQTGVNAPAAVQALKEQVIQPYKDINDLFTKNPYLTALYTTMGPEDMTQDPTFIPNKDLPKVSSMHLATGIRKCSAEYSYNDAPVEITLANGLKYSVARNTGIIAVGGSPQPTGSPKPIDMPAADRIEQFKSVGLASLISDNRDLISRALGILKGSTVSVGGATFGFDASGKVVALPTKPGKGVTAVGGFGCAGCATTTAPTTKQGANETFTYALVVMGFFGYRRWLGRRRR